MEGNCGYFRRLLSFIFTKWCFLSYRNVSRNIHPSLHCASTTRATEHARGIPACIFEHAQKTDAPEFATMAEVMFSYFVVEHNLPAAITGPLSSLASYMCPDSTIAKAMTCVRTKTTILTRCLAVGGEGPYYRPMSVLESRRSRPDESRHRNTDKRLPHRSRTANTNNPCVLFVINQRKVMC